MLAVGRGLWPMTTLMLRSFSLPVAVAGGLWPMTTLMLRGFSLLVAVAPGLGALRETRRLGRRFLYKAGLLALPRGEW